MALCDVTKGHFPKLCNSFQTFIISAGRQLNFNMLHLIHFFPVISHYVPELHECQQWREGLLKKKKLCSQKKNERFLQKIKFSRKLTFNLCFCLVATFGTNLKWLRGGLETRRKEEPCACVCVGGRVCVCVQMYVRACVLFSDEGSVFMLRREELDFFFSKNLSFQMMFWVFWHVNLKEQEV